MLTVRKIEKEERANASIFLLSFLCQFFFQKIFFIFYKLLITLKKIVYDLGLTLITNFRLNNFCLDFKYEFYTAKSSLDFKYEFYTAKSSLDFEYEFYLTKSGFGFKYEFLHDKV